MGLSKFAAEKCSYQSRLFPWQGVPGRAGFHTVRNEVSLYLVTIRMSKSLTYSYFFW